MDPAALTQGDLRVRPAGEPEHGTLIGHATDTTTCSGASVTFTGLIPAQCTVSGVTCRVTTGITGATSWQCGYATDPDAWGAAIATAAGTTTSIADFTVINPVNFTSSSPTDLILTPNGSNFTNGAVKVTVHYTKLIAATA